MALETIILAAGQGKRMKSALPKVLHQVAGKPMLAHIIERARQLEAERIHVVIGHGAEQVKNELDSPDINWVLQDQRLGTGDAVMRVMPVVNQDSNVLILNGDVPLIRAPTLQRLFQPDCLSVLTAVVQDPNGLGRIIRDSSGNVVAIVEQKDATVEQRTINEINTNFIAAPARLLAAWLARLNNNNAQNEYYLTDVIALAVQDEVSVSAIIAADSDEILGVNNRAELALVERIAQRRLAEQLMQDGVTVLDPNRLDIRGDCRCGQDCVIDVNVILEGEVEIGDQVKIGANTIIRNSRIGDQVIIAANCVIEQATIAAHCVIGPYARLRPNTVLEQNVRVGNFVEIKKSRIGKDSKANHLSYIGDSVVGQEVNIGAGVITCNYDGVNKHKTVIGDHAFVGSDCQFVAPVKIGDHVTIGAGSTITADVGDHQLAISRGRQRNLSGWQRPTKKA